MSRREKQINNGSVSSEPSSKVILISGSRQGIGRYLAEHYLEQEWQVLGCSRQASDLTHERYHHYLLDVGDETALKEMFSHIRKTYRCLDVLVNNAGLSTKGLVSLLSRDSIERTLRINTEAGMLMAREALRLMRKSPHGRIVNISSIHVPICLPGASVYGASKAALEQFGKVMAREVFSYGITVNTLSLSVVESTGMADELDEDTMEAILAQTISQTKIRLTDVRYAMDFLISEQAGLITGQTLYVGGI